MNSYIRCVLRRVFFVIITLQLIAAITFFLMQSLPDTPYTSQEYLSPETIEMLNKQVGLDKPVIVQCRIYLSNLLQGDFGTSFQFKSQPVAHLLTGRTGPSLQLGLQAIISGTVLGAVLGTTSIMKQSTWTDTSSTFAAILGRSIPNSVFVVLLQHILAIRLQVLLITKWDDLVYTISPTVVLAMLPLTDSVRFIRTEMAEVLHSGYVELAKVKGLSRWKIAFKHGLRSSSVPLMTLLGPLAVALITGSLVVKSISTTSDIEGQLVKSITTNDYPTIMAITIPYLFMLILVILVMDLLYGLVDPRIRVSGGSQG